MNLFDILGPIMVGPSSSHTAGAVRIGYISRILLKDRPIHADIYLHGSFATTGVGHGTDKALIAGLLGMSADDIRIPNSFEIADKEQLTFQFNTIFLKEAHPNTALLKLSGAEGKTLEIEAASVGGGRVLVKKLDGIDVNFSGDRPTLVVHNYDKPGHVAKVTSLLYENDINIATMQLFRASKGGYSVMVLELDQALGKEELKKIEALNGIIKVTYLNTDSQVSSKEEE